MEVLIVRKQNQRTVLWTVIWKGISPADFGRGCRKKRLITEVGVFKKG